MEISVQSAIYELRSKFSKITDQQAKIAINRAINHTIAKGRTSANREIRSLYNIKAGYVSKTLRLQRSTSSTLMGEITATGRPLPLIAFPRTRQTQKGVSVDIMGNRKVVKGAFLAEMPNGHKGVFARGAYRHGSFEWRKKRLKRGGNDLPIAELSTVSIPTAFSNDKVLEVLKKQLTTDFPGRLQHEFVRLLK